jgi:hypothetical protein
LANLVNDQFRSVVMGIVATALGHHLPPNAGLGGSLGLYASPFLFKRLGSAMIGRGQHHQGHGRESRPKGME